MDELVPSEYIERRIYLLRGQKVMMDRDLATLYGVPNKALNQAVRRNRRRFPKDFMFRLNRAEMENWKSQLVTSIPAIKMGLRKRPHAFTEQGVAMLSTVLRSERAIRVNIEIMRAFVKLRQMLVSRQDLARRLDELEKKYDGQFRVVFDALRDMMAPAEQTKPVIGFRPSGQGS